MSNTPTLHQPTVPQQLPDTDRLTAIESKFRRWWDELQNLNSPIP